MDELVKLVSEKTGIAEPTARQAVQIVLDFLKKRLPGPVASQVDAVVQGGQAGDMLKGLGGMLGGRK